MKRLIFLSVSFSILLILPQFMNAQTVRVEYTVVGDQIQLVGFGCPASGGQSALAVSGKKLDLTKDERNKLNELLVDFIDGDNYKNRPNRRNPDANTTVVRGPFKGAGRKICDFLREVY